MKRGLERAPAIGTCLLLAFACLGCDPTTSTTQIVLDIRLDPATVWPKHATYRVDVVGLGMVHQWSRADANKPTAHEQELVLAPETKDDPREFTVQVWGDATLLVEQRLAFAENTALVAPLAIGPHCLLAPCTPLETAGSLPSYDERCAMMTGLCDAEACIAISGDRSHCGACGAACASTEICSYGACVARP